MAAPSAFVPWMIPQDRLFDTGPSHARGSDTRFTNLSKEEDMILLRPIVQEKHAPSQLPSLQDVMFFSEDDGSTSSPNSRSNSLSSWSPYDDSSSDTSRKNSIASLLNSPPPSLKRGRPRHTAPGQQHKRVKRPVEEEKKRGSAVTKGLRHFSKLVSDKVAERGVTTYNQVADELAAEIRDGRKQGYDQKNIRRRVYDALNVLMAMDIIAKDKKEIRWKGIPASLHRPVVEEQHESTRKQEWLMQQIQQEEQRQHELMQAMHRMRSVVSNKMEQYLQIKKLICRNEHKETSKPTHDDDKVALPFFVVTCDEPYQVDVSNDGHQAVISSNSDDDMPIYEDARILQSLGFHHMSVQDKLAFLPDPNWSHYLLHDTIAAPS
ncbi:E2F/DP family winged-helix DNA-binding domain-containing protein [Fennellomyces sp. T-0311]|nr:E2F/DP family winged-helix DNA-binding domain-containing protein [Fennellomyces sp. T-0311]